MPRTGQITARSDHQGCRNHVHDVDGEFYAHLASLSRKTVVHTPRTWSRSLAGGMGASVIPTRTAPARMRTDVEKSRPDEAGENDALQFLDGYKAAGVSGAEQQSRPGQVPTMCRPRPREPQARARWLSSPGAGGAPGRTARHFTGSSSRSEGASMSRLGRLARCPRPAARKVYPPHRRGRGRGDDRGRNKRPPAARDPALYGP